MPRAAASRARRDQILRHARALFARKGYHDTSIADIIEDAGIARGTFYLYFKGKREVFGALLDILFHELDVRVKPVVLGPAEPSPLEQVKDNVRRVLELVVAEPEYLRIVLHHGTALDSQSVRALGRLYDGLLRMIEKSLQLGKRMGIVRPCDTRVVSACILGTVKEVVVRTATRGAAKIDPAAIAEEIVEYGLRGIAAS
ncbi:MAG: TetR/AcrR family transcriptional regulator [Acidobacteriota bacterium]